MRTSWPRAKVVLENLDPKSQACMDTPDPRSSGWGHAASHDDLRVISA